MNPFCAGHAQLGNGDILVVGGDMRAVPGMADGRRAVRVYRPCPANATAQSCPNGGSWVDLYQMQSGRWYPTVTTLEDGSAIIISGTTDSLDFSKDINAIRNPTVSPLYIVASQSASQLDSDSLTDHEYCIQYEYYPPKPAGNGPAWPRDLEILNWAHPFVLYPMVYQLPSGGVFLFVSNKTVIINPRDESINFRVPDMPLMEVNRKILIKF
jgi:hypothetical protein